MPFDPDQFIGNTPAVTEELVVEEKKKSSEFDPDQFINSGVSQAPTAAELGTERTPGAMDLSTGAIAPTVTGAAFAQPTGINPQAVKQGLNPMIEAVPKTWGIYKNQPLAGVLDAAAVFGLGAPPPVASVQGGKGIMALPGAISATASEVGKITSTGQLDPSGRPISIDPYQGLRDSLRNAGAGDLYDDLMKEGYAKGGNNKVLNNLEKSQRFQQLLASNPEVAQAFESYRGAVPGKLSQVGRVVGPAVRGLARVAGPAGLAYDVYQAQEFARESQLGPRLAEGQGGQAQQAFRNMNVPYGRGFTNTMTADQAGAVLESGSARDIQAFGGRDYLNELIRKKAAEKVLGPIAPGGF